MQRRKKKLQIVNFIRCIEQNSFLYDRNHPSFGNVQLKNEMWEKIAKDFSIDDGASARFKWKNLVDARRRAQKLIENGQNRPPFVYNEEMEFIDAFERRHSQGWRNNMASTSNVDEISKDLDDFNGLNHFVNESLNEHKHIMMYNDEDEIEEQGNSNDTDLNHFGQSSFEQQHSVTATANPIASTSTTVFTPNDSSKVPTTTTTESAEDAFGRMVSLTLRRMEPRKRAEAQLQIHSVLFKCEFDGN